MSGWFQVKIKFLLEQGENMLNMAIFSGLFLKWENREICVTI